VENGYVKIRRHGKNVLAWEEQAETIAKALIQGEGCEAVEEAGRGTVYRFELPGGCGMVRRYKRGGLVRFFLSDAYILSNRPLREFRLHLQIQKEGLPVPKLLGACWERRGLFVRGAIATEGLPAQNLCEFLSHSPEGPDEELRRCGTVIRRMHDMHVWHADLQVKNILVGAGGPWLIDFDNAVIRPHLSPLLRARNLLRLRRSIQKNGLSPAYFKPLCDGYGVEALPEWLSRIYDVKGRVSDLTGISRNP